MKNDAMRSEADGQQDNNTISHIMGKIHSKKLKKKHLEMRKRPIKCRLCKIYTMIPNLERKELYQANKD